ncbi:MAG: YhcH/YjgK/YiaL family protein [Victivallaceae bacterium]
MIIDFNKNLKNYEYLNAEVLRKAFDFIDNATMTTPDGRYELDGDKFFVNVQSYNTKLLAESKVEVHHRYVDIQTLIDGKEVCLVSNVENLAVISEFNPTTDLAFFTFKPEISDKFILQPGKFAIFFPGEGHMPMVAVEECSCPVKKMIVKIDYDYLMNK